MQVNLLKEVKVLTESQFLLERKILMLAIISFAVVVCMSISLFAWQLLVSKRLSTAQQIITDSSREMAGSLASSNAQGIYMKSRLQMIKVFMTDRSLTREALQRIFSINVLGATVTNVTFASESRVVIQVSSLTPTVFDQAYRYYEDNRDFFTLVVNRGTSRANDRSYVMTLELDLPKSETTKTYEVTK